MKTHFLLTVLFYSAFCTLAAQQISPDLMFADSGRVVLGIDGVNSEFTHLQVLPTGKILVCGVGSLGGTDHYFIGQLLSNGDLDPDFGTNGRVEFEIPENYCSATDMLLQDDGKFIVAGIVAGMGGGQDFGMVRFLANGQPDIAFGNNGVVLADFREIQSFDSQLSYKIGKQSDGKLILGGKDVNEVSNIAFVRFSADGIPDSTFGTESVSLTYMGGQFSIIGDPITIIDGNDRLYWACTSTSNSRRGVYLRRFTSAGEPDLTFNGTGILNITMTEHSRLKDMFVSGNKLMVLATFEKPNAFKNVLIKLNEDGSLDNSYGEEGMFVFTAEPNRKETANCMIQGPGSKITICGTSTTNLNTEGRVYLARALDNGTIDAGFANNGGYSFERSTNSALFSDIGFSSGNRIIVAGSIIKNGRKSGYVMAFNEEGSNNYFNLEADKFLLFPNPIQAGMPVTLKTIGKSVKCISICDLQGRLVQNVSVSNVQETEFRFILDAPIQSGVYTLTVHLSSGSESKLIVVN